MSADHKTDCRAQPSKTQRKHEMRQLQALGESLIDLPVAQLAALPLPENLREAVLAARRMTKRGALHRQRQYIGKLMRSLDAEPIRAALEEFRARQRATAARFKRAERWREQVLERGDEAIEEFMLEHPRADRQHLHRLVRASHKERERQLAPRSARALFRYLHELIKSDDKC